MAQLFNILIGQLINYDGNIPSGNGGQERCGVAAPHSAVGRRRQGNRFQDY